MVRKTLEIKNLNIDLTEDYTQLLNTKGYNWVEFNFLKAYVEADRQHGCFEIELALLGLGIRFYWTYNNSALKRTVKKYNKILKGKFIGIDMREPEYSHSVRTCTLCDEKYTTMLKTHKYVCERCIEKDEPKTTE